MDLDVKDNDVILTDEDVFEEDSGDSGGLYPYDPNGSRYRY